MYLRTITYQLGVRVKSLVPCFHKSHLENLMLLVIGIAYGRSVSLPKAASAVPYRRIQVESRVERFERLLQCKKLIPLEALKPVAKKVLKGISRRGRVEICAIIDRTMINDTINLLYISVAYGRRSLPLGWVSVVADREFHSIYLAQWIEKTLGLNFVLRIKAGTKVYYQGCWFSAGELARKGQIFLVLWELP